MEIPKRKNYKGMISFRLIQILYKGFSMVATDLVVEVMVTLNPTLAAI